MLRPLTNHWPVLCFYFAVANSILPWRILFCRGEFYFAAVNCILPWRILFCRGELYFAVKNFILPWRILFCREEFYFAVTVVGHRTYLISWFANFSKLFMVWTCVWFSCDKLVDIIWFVKVVPARLIQSWYSNVVIVLNAYCCCSLAYGSHPGHKYIHKINEY